MQKSVPSTVIEQMDPLLFRNLCSRCVCAADVVRLATTRKQGKACDNQRAQSEEAIARAVFLFHLRRIFSSRWQRTACALSVVHTLRWNRASSRCSGFHPSESHMPLSSSKAFQRKAASSPWAPKADRKPRRAHCGLAVPG